MLETRLVFRQGRELQVVSDHSWRAAQGDRQSRGLEVQEDREAGRADRIDGSRAREATGRYTTQEKAMASRLIADCQSGAIKILHAAPESEPLTGYALEVSRDPRASFRVLDGVRYVVLPSEVVADMILRTPAYAAHVGRIMKEALSRAEEIVSLDAQIEESRNQLRSFAPEMPEDDAEAQSRRQTANRYRH